ncbi:MAG: 5'-methylthioadenosine phosphorylase, partial [Methylotenera sp.]|nr:5'-methylthioadenosine phosphorylase [Methylotenera sp.]
MLAIIGGTGLTQLDNLNITKRLIVRTPYGEPSQPLIFGEIAGREVIFLARHGNGHTIPPHEVNYRANISALHLQGVTEIAAVATVGGIHQDLAAGIIAIPHQIIDYTYGRKNT